MTYLIAGWRCQDGVPTRCEEGPGRPCDCGCGDDLFCDAITDTCVARRAPGEPCNVNRQCLSDNCGSIARDAAICFVAPGEPCDGTNCGECAQLPGGATECLQACMGNGACPGLTGPGDPLCWGTVRAGGYYCRAECDLSGTVGCPAGYECRRLDDEASGITADRCYPVTVLYGPASCGEPGTVDACGVCDEDPTNDCTP
ncbi:MAG: hypothetical protein KC619_08260 [Myxococcales bacterium]|nr:hypothetical protein [Myxococcales bacterium]